MEFHSSGSISFPAFVAPVRKLRALAGSCKCPQSKTHAFAAELSSRSQSGVFCKIGGRGCTKDRHFWEEAWKWTSDPYTPYTTLSFGLSCRLHPDKGGHDEAMCLGRSTGSTPCGGRTGSNARCLPPKRVRPVWRGVKWRLGRLGRTPQR